MKLRPALLAAVTAGSLGIAGIAIGIGTASASTPPQAPASSTAGPAADHPEPGDPEDTGGKTEKAEPGGEQPDGADGPGGHADPPGDINHEAGPEER